MQLIVPKTIEEFDAFLEKYKAQNPQKYAIKEAKGEFAAFRRSLTSETPVETPVEIPVETPAIEETPVETPVEVSSTEAEVPRRRGRRPQVNN